MGILIDSFSGTAAELKGSNRTADNVLASLRGNPRVSTWDMSEHGWLRTAIKDLERAGKVTEDKAEQYPWHRFTVSERTK